MRAIREWCAQQPDSDKRCGGPTWTSRLNRSSGLAIPASWLDQDVKQNRSDPRHWLDQDIKQNRSDPQHSLRSIYWKSRSSRQLYYSRWPEVILLKKTHAAHVTKATDGMFQTQSLPLGVRSENGPPVSSAQ